MTRRSQACRHSASPCRRPAAPVANYVPFVRTGNLARHLRPALPRAGRQARRPAQGQARRGDLRRGRASRRRGSAPSTCWRRLKAALGDLDRVVALRAARRLHQRRRRLRRRCPPIMNGASDLMVEVLGDKGRHARSTIGVAELPLDAAVEVEGDVRGRDERAPILARSPGRSPIAACTTAAAGVIENTISAARGRHRRRLRASNATSSSRADGEAMVFHDFDARPPDGGSGPGRRATAAAARRPSPSTGRRATGFRRSTDFLDRDRRPRAAGHRDQEPLRRRHAADATAPPRSWPAYAGPVAVKSFDPGIVAPLRTLAPDRAARDRRAERATTYAEWAAILAARRKHALANLLHFGETAARFPLLAGRGPALAPCPYLCRQVLGMPVMTWTVRTAEDRAAGGAPTPTRWSSRASSPDAEPELRDGAATMAGCARAVALPATHAPASYSGRGAESPRAEVPMPQPGMPRKRCEAEVPAATGLGDASRALDSDAGNRIAGDYNPFVSHAFLSALRGFGLRRRGAPAGLPRASAGRGRRRARCSPPRPAT